jgi:thymidylate synthase
MRTFTNVSEAYLRVLAEVLDAGDPCAPRGLPIREIRDYMFEVQHPDSGQPFTHDPARNERIRRYLEAERELALQGARSAKEWGDAAKFWENIGDPAGDVNSAYGWLIWHNPSCRGNWRGQPMTPWKWARTSLEKDKDTRQAFLRLSLPEHQYLECKDQPCTMHVNFLLRENRLHATAVMRSNDVVKGLAYDMPFFVYLQERMTRELYRAYPDLKIGAYRHLSHSMHVYEKDIAVVERMLGRKAPS